MITIAYKQCADCCEHESVHALRDELLRLCLGVSDPLGAVSVADGGRPMLSIDGADISLSHSDGLVAVALSVSGYCASADGLCRDGVTVWALDVPCERIGLDIESVGGKRPEHCRRIAARYFTADERQSLEQASDYCAEFVRIWTQKESICKCSGVGLAGLRRADTNLLPDGLSVLTDRISVGGTDYYLSICMQSAAKNKNCTIMRLI